MSTGSIRVQSENIFPIIKKFLYSDHEIFIRELVSNAVDATQKIKSLARMGKTDADTANCSITVKLDATAKTLHIIDEGIGMTEEEVDRYLNQVAFSGAEEFLEKYKGQNEANIIGHFGLGFYSSFMVSKKVEVITKSYQPGTAAVRWECDGSPNYTITPDEKTERGTEIILHIDDDSTEFLDAHRIKSILEKFCKFLPVPIYFEEVKEKIEVENKVEAEEKAEEKAEIEADEAVDTTTGNGRQLINNPNPAWVKKPSELTDEDYKSFYNELYPYEEAPLFWIHLNVDYPFNLTGILYFPKIKHSYEIQKDKIQLYSNQVFVTDQVKDIVPEFLMLLQGIIDSPDIPLNVSRSYLQGDPNVKKISSYITKKVADKLEEIFKADRKSYEEKWESIGLFVKYGMLTDEKFYDKAKQIALLKEVSDEKYYTLEEYVFGTETLQKNKDGKTVVLYATDIVQQNSYIEAATNKGYLVVLLNDLIDPSWIGQMEQKYEKIQFTRVDADITEHLIDKGETGEIVLSKEDAESLEATFKQQITLPGAKIALAGLSSDAAPVIATRPEFMRRMKDMAALNGGGGMMGFYAQMPDEVNFTVNANHPIQKTILQQQDNSKKETMVKNLVDLALLSQGALKGNDLTQFINRTIQLMENE